MPCAASCRRGSAQSVQPRPASLQQPTKVSLSRKLFPGARELGKKHSVRSLESVGEGRSRGRGEAAGVVGGVDFIYSQKNGVEEQLFKGSVLGVDADVASLDYRETALRSLAHVDASLYVPERFKQRLGVHLAKNYLADVIPGHVPLILGIWGGKGAGKTFCVELACAQMGITPVIVSAGELEDEVAGLPGLRIRDRYLEAASMRHNQGKPTCLIVNDIDAGLGRFKGAQMTVNNQNVQGTLMNLCDDPERVSSGKIWIEGSAVARVPIVVTANDLSTVYAPLLRDGRMDKFYWEPSKEELAQMLCRLFDEDLTTCRALLAEFPQQPLDFFGAIKSRLADRVVRDWIQRVGVEGIGAQLTVATSRVGLELGSTSLEDMVAAGRELALEQQHLIGKNLAREYFKRGWDDPQEEGLESKARLRAEEVASRWKQPAGTGEVSEAMLAARAALVADSSERIAQAVADLETKQIDDHHSDEAFFPPSPWRCLDPIAAKELMDTKGYIFLDVRSARDHDRDAYKKAVSVPIVKTVGFGLSAVAEPLVQEFLAQIHEKYPSKDAKLLVVGGEEGDSGPLAAEALWNDGYSCVVEVAGGGMASTDGEDTDGDGSVVEKAGGYGAWSKLFRTNGERRVFGKWGDPTSGELEYWTASN